MVYNICSDSVPVQADFTTEISAASAVVMYADGSCVFEKNADEKRLIASTTKLMTALVSIELSEPDQPIEVAAQCCGVEGSSMYLTPGQILTADELIAGLLLCSGNDAAEALAVSLCGSEAAFVEKMNEKAAALGLSNSSFTNPHGLDAENHYSTARDLAKLMLRCMENERFARLCALPSLQVDEQYYVNHNKLLGLCDGCLGGKTGYTRAAGRCLVSCCEKNDLRLICVTLSDPDDWHDQSALYDWAYAGFRWLTLSGVCRFEVPVISGSRDKLTVQPAEDARVLIPSGEEVRLQAELPRFVFAPVNSQEAAGHVDVLLQNRRIAVFPLYYTQGAAMAYPVFQTHAAEEGNPWPNEFKNSYPKRALCPAVRRSRPFLQAGCW